MLPTRCLRGKCAVVPGTPSHGRETETTELAGWGQSGTRGVGGGPRTSNVRGVHCLEVSRSAEMRMEALRGLKGSAAETAASLVRDDELAPSDASRLCQLWRADHAPCVAQGVIFPPAPVGVLRAWRRARRTADQRAQRKRPSEIGFARGDHTNWRPCGHSRFLGDGDNALSPRTLAPSVHQSGERAIPQHAIVTRMSSHLRRRAPEEQPRTRANYAQE
jgi:hypothetical protein